jgi:flagellar assembly protein FliH
MKARLHWARREKILSKIIRGKPAEEADRWNIPPMEQSGGKKAATNTYSESLAAAWGQFPSLQDIETLKKDAYNEAYQKGLADASAHIEQESGRLLSVARSLLDQLGEPIQMIDEQVRQQLVALAIAIAKQLIKTEVKHNPEHILKLVEQALTVLPDSPSTIYVYLSSQDTSEIKEKFQLADEHPNWKIVEDPALESGGCKVFTESSSVDLTIDAQLARIAAKFLESEDEGLSLE